MGSDQLGGAFTLRHPDPRVHTSGAASARGRSIWETGVTVHLIKLCVGAESVEDLLAWQRDNPSPLPSGERRHVTRMWPKRAEELLDGGSLYWVIRGAVLCRQRLVRLDPVEKDGAEHCGLILDPAVIRTEPAPRRPFQGWRYLDPKEAPRDLAQRRDGDDLLPPGMAEALAAFGVR